MKTFLRYLAVSVCRWKYDIEGLTGHTINELNGSVYWRNVGH